MGYIYFIGNEHGAIKIGFTGWHPLHGRMKQMQTANADTLTLLGILKGNSTREKELQDQFSHLAIRGEWFEASDDLIDYVESLDGVDREIIQRWRRRILSSRDVLVTQRAISIRKAEAEQIVEDAQEEAKEILENTRLKAAKIIQQAIIETDRIKKNAHKEAKKIVSNTIDLVKKDAIIEIEKLISGHVPRFVFGCRCCKCGQALPTVEERNDGLPWCDMCWVNHSIFDTGRFDAIVSGVCEEVYSDPAECPYVKSGT